MWTYLDELGVLDSGTDTEIKKAKREYRKLYKRIYQREYRVDHPEFSISLTQEEEAIIAEAARKHHRSRTAYIKESSIAYTSKLYLVPDPTAVANLEQLLNLIYQEIQVISQLDSRPFNCYKELFQRIEKIETEVAQIMYHPPEVNTHS